MAEARKALFWRYGVRIGIPLQRCAAYLRQVKTITIQKPAHPVQIRSDAGG